MATTTDTKAGTPTCDPSGDIDVSNKLPSKSDLAKVADLPVLDAAGKKHTFKSLYANDDRQRTFIIFIRHFFCGVSDVKTTIIERSILIYPRTAKNTSKRSHPL